MASPKSCECKRIETMPMQTVNQVNLTWKLLTCEMSEIARNGTDVTGLVQQVPVCILYKLQKI